MIAKKEVEKITLDYRGQTVSARRLTIASELPISLPRAWRNLKTPALLHFVARGMFRFQPVGSERFPREWEVGPTYALRMWLFGFLPFGGVHYLRFDTIDADQYRMETQEWDSVVKVWNHKLSLRDLADGNTYYEDTVTIYAGLLTGLVTAFAEWFFQHRHRRWRVIAAQQLDFS